jgi:hypothetical protein
MITGLKIARDPAKVTYDGSDAADLAANLETTLDPEQTIKAGGEASRHRSNAATYNETPKSAYVFAYRLRKLQVVWRKRFALRDYQTGGDLHGIDRGDISSDESGDDEDGVEIESYAFEQQDFGRKLPEREEKLVAVDENDNTACLVIRASPEENCTGPSGTLCLE